MAMNEGDARAALRELNSLVQQALPESTRSAWLDNIRQWRQNGLPVTTSGFRGFESAGTDPNTMAHYRPLARDYATDPGTMPRDFMFGINPQHGLSSMQYEQMKGERTGWYPEPAYPTGERADQIFNHEMGHALDQRLEDFATHKIINENDSSLSVKLRELRAKLVKDSLTGDLGSGYARSAVVKEMGEAGLVPYTGMGMQSEPQASMIASDVVKRFGGGGESLIAKLKSLPDPVLRSMAKEPIAEAFSKDPGVLNEVLGHAEAGGFQGMITPELAMRGAAGMAIPLIAHAAFPHNELVDQAANGAGLGMAFGGLPGAAIGAGANVLAHHFLGIGL